VTAARSSGWLQAPTADDVADAPVDADLRAWVAVAHTHLRCAGDGAAEKPAIGAHLMFLAAGDSTNDEDAGPATKVERKCCSRARRSSTLLW
jgi:hypothetical protein